MGLFKLGKLIVKEIGQEYQRTRAQQEQQQQQQYLQQQQYQQYPDSSQHQYQQSSYQVQQQHYPPPPSQLTQTSSSQSYGQSRTQPAYAPSEAQPQTQQQQQQSPTRQQWKVGPPPRSNTPPPPQTHPCGITPITECIEGPLPVEFDWFIHPAAPEFLVCTKCYVDHIYNTQFSSAFKQIHLANDAPRRCSFSPVRLEGVLWPAAVKSSSLRDVVAYMQKRQSIPHCPGANIQYGTWYTSPDIPNSTFCPACYEEFLTACSFGSKFHVVANAEGFCDGSTAYIKRMFELYYPTNNWSAFAEQARARLQFPRCEKMTPVASNSCSWYEATRGPPGIEICASCFCDYFYETPDEQYWRITVPRSAQNMCTFSGSTNISLTIDRTLYKKDHSIFWKALEEGNKYPYCYERGTSGTTWYTLPSKPKDFLVCGACYSTVVYTFGGSRWFVPKSSSIFGSNTNLCAFNMGHPRFHLNFVAYIESILQGTCKPLSKYANTVANTLSLPASIPTLNPLPIATMSEGPSWQRQVSTSSHGRMSNLDLDMKKMEMDRDHRERMAMLNKAHVAGLSANITKFMGDVHGCNGYAVGNSQQGWFKNEMSYQGVLEQQAAQDMANQALYGNTKIRY